MGQEKLTAYVFILQNCAANLGGMLTPFGNPQNLYLFDHYHIPCSQFLSIMLLPFALSTGLILLCCLLIPRQVLAVPQRELTLDKPQLSHTDCCSVWPWGWSCGRSPYPSSLAVIAAALAVMDPRALKSVDWGLLVTFAAFFVFSGNMAGFSRCGSCSADCYPWRPAGIGADVPGDQQRPRRHSAEPVHGPLPGAVDRRQHRRHRNADCVPGQPHHLPGIHPPLPGADRSVPGLFTLVSFGFLAILLAALSL